MSWTTRLSRGAAALCLSLTALGAQGATAYSNMYVFGDSLSDSGNDLLLIGDVPSPDYYTDGTNIGRFTNGLNYADRLAASFGLTVTPATTTATALPPQPTAPIVNRNNYAHGGARTYGIWPQLEAIGGLGFNAQIDRYVNDAGGIADPNALYVLWIGANDMSDLAVSVLDPRKDEAQIKAEISQGVGDTVGDIVTAFVTLQGLGAKNFLIGNSPDLSLTPAVRQLGAMYGPKVEPLFQAVSAGFNATLAYSLPFYTLPTSSVTIFDAFALQTEMTNNPAAYGLTNVSGACYDGPIEGIPGANPADHMCSTPNEYLYFDAEHPSATLHYWAANALYAQLVPEPAGWALSLTALGLMGFVSRRRARR